MKWAIDQEIENGFFKNRPHQIATCFCRASETCN
jgi:hypothetical protein